MSETTFGKPLEEGIIEVDSASSNPPQRMIAGHVVHEDVWQQFITLCVGLKAIGNVVAATGIMSEGEENDNEVSEV